ncbi:MAG: biotin/lipoyl-binding protein [Myxococcaceae bacterium]|nr:biotin/lipoyl-binding protein [Myxococcaceae bacterium]MCA3012967.1 biotin/lipoyl-binding protein [Myxococcaceae bacterium]
MPRALRYLAKQLSKTATAVEVDVVPLGDDRYALTLQGERLELEALVLPGGAMTLRLGALTVVAEFEERGDEIGVLVQGQVTRFDVVDERRARARAATATFEVEGRQTVLSPMPGKVVKVFVKPGDTVTEGQGLVVVEAMKMENELKAPKAGTVTEVLAREGSTVENGAKLVVVE